MDENIRTAEVTEEKVPALSKLWLCLADCLCGTANGLLTGGGMSYFFVNYLGLDKGLASIVWLIFGIWNAFNDPLFGYISDRTKSKLGRRIPYIRYGALFYAIVFIATWFSWTPNASDAALFIQMLVTLFLFDTLYTAIATSLYVMPYTMAVSNKARSNIFLWKIFFTLISLGVPLVLLPMIKPDPGESPRQFQIIMTVLGIVIFAVIFASTFFYKEKVQSENEETENIFKAVVSCFKNRSFVVFEVLSFTVIFIQNILMQGVIYYFDAYENVPMAFAYGALGVGALFGVVLFATKTSVWGVKKCTLLMCIVFSIGAAVMVFFGRFLPVALACFFTAGMGFAGGMYLIPLMNGDVIDYDETVTGIRREGMYAGVNSLITKPAISLANAAFLMIIGWFGFDFDKKTALQTAFAKQGILVAWMAIPAILLVICAVALKWYPLAGEKWQQTKRELEQRHKND
jgi:GPH family glycoside/pentoside/hexuronide:cation symporter